MSSLEHNVPTVGGANHQAWDCPSFKRVLDDRCYLNDENKICQNYSEWKASGLISCQNGINSGLASCESQIDDTCNDKLSCPNMENGAWCMTNKDDNGKFNTILKCEENNGTKCLKYHNYNEITQNDLFTPLPECKLKLNFDGIDDEEYDLQTYGTPLDRSIFCTDNGTFPPKEDGVHVRVEGASGLCIGYPVNLLGLDGLFSQSPATIQKLGNWHKPEKKKYSTIYKCSDITPEMRIQAGIQKHLTSIEFIYTPT